MLPSTTAASGLASLNQHVVKRSTARNWKLQKTASNCFDKRTDSMAKPRSGYANTCATVWGNAGKPQPRLSASLEASPVMLAIRRDSVAGALDRPAGWNDAEISKSAASMA